jgi:hypothetical protein
MHAEYEDMRCKRHAEDVQQRWRCIRWQRALRAWAVRCATWPVQSLRPERCAMRRQYSDAVQLDRRWRNSDIVFCAEHRMCNIELSGRPLRIWGEAARLFLRRTEEVHFFGSVRRLY